MIQMLANHWGEVVGLVIFIAYGVGLYFALRGTTDRLGDQLKALAAEAKASASALERRVATVEAWIQSHTNDPMPHQNCPAHSTAIDDIGGRLDRIQDDIRDMRDEVNASVRELHKAIFDALKPSK